MVPLGRPGASSRWGCGPECRFYLQPAGAPSQPPAASPPPPAAWEIFPMEACPSPPYFNKSMEEGQGIPPSSSFTSQPVPHLLCPPPWPGQGKLQGSRPWQGAEWEPMPSPAAPQLHRQAGGRGLQGSLKGRDSHPGGECYLGPPAALWSRVPNNCKSQTHP